MRALPVLVCLVAMAACAQPPETTGAKPPAPAGAAAKRAPPQPGEKISPVIAFRGEAADWNLQIENSEGYGHTVELDWDESRAHGTGTLEYQPGPSTDRILLRGTLDTHSGAKAMTVEIATAECTDALGVSYPQQVRIEVAGRVPMRGCGELAK